MNPISLAYVLLLSTAARATAGTLKFRIKIENIFYHNDLMQT